LYGDDGVRRTASCKKKKQNLTSPGWVRTHTTTTITNIIVALVGPPGAGNVRFLFTFPCLVRFVSKLSENTSFHSHTKERKSKKQNKTKTFSRYCLRRALLRASPHCCNNNSTSRASTCCPICLPEYRVYVTRDERTKSSGSQKKKKMASPTRFSSELHKIQTVIARPISTLRRDTRNLRLEFLVKLERVTRF